MSQLSMLKKAARPVISKENVEKGSKMLAQMKAMDAVILRKQMLIALVATFAESLDEDGADVAVIEDSLDKVLDGIVSDDEITEDAAAEMKAKIMAPHRKRKDLVANYMARAVDGFIQHMSTKSVTPELAAAMESVKVYDKVYDEAGDLVVDQVVCAAAQQCFLSFKKYFPSTFVTRLS